MTMSKPTTFYLQVEDYCEGCGEFIPLVEKVKATTLGDIREKYFTTVYCCRHTRCRNMYEQLSDHKE